MYRYPFQLSASILSADFARLGEEVMAVLSAGVDSIHIDVMDNHYVPNLTIGPLICSALRSYGITVPLEVHLMVKPVDRLIPDFAAAGATTLIFHPEASEHVDRTLQLVHDHGCQAGLALNPATSLDSLTYVMHKLDQVLLMSVNPGFPAQTFIPEIYDKIHQTKRLLAMADHAILLSIDGGVSADNAQELHKSGADILVVGSGIFKTTDYRAAITAIRGKAVRIEH